MRNRIKLLFVTDIRRELGINITDPVILFASMNFEIKGLDDILFSLAKLKAQNRKFKLIVAGKGNIKKYTKMAKEAQIISDVIFTGPVSKEKYNQNVFSQRSLYYALQI